jgi:hypothetical protein
MPNLHKLNVIETLRARFGEMRKIPGSDSLFTLGNEAARVYLRYSKVHEKGRTFFGLREVDLRQLEGHNSFLGFILNDGSAPLFIPYADFEEVFRTAEAAKDGQYKVQLTAQADARELYVARQGRFNVEGYAGYDLLDRSIDTQQLRAPLNLTHAQVQTLLGGIGSKKGYDIWVPAANAGTLDWSLTKRFSLRKTIPSGFEKVRSILSEIDMVWVERGRERIAGLFEVEHSTPVYSGLLRFNDILLTEPKVSRFSIVSNDIRRSLFARQLHRPTFTRSGLSELTSFLEYANVHAWHARITKGETDG